MKLINEKTSIVLIYIGVAITSVSLFFFFWQDNSLSFALPIKSDKFGQFGDLIGGIVGSVWALAGVILFYIALKEQRNDFLVNQKAFELQVDALNHQIEEFKLQRQELENSRKVYEEQSKTLKIQQFESIFFSLLNVYLTIKNNLNNLDDKKDYFKSKYETLNTIYEPMNSVRCNHNTMVEKYVNLFNEQRGHLSHYYKSFYRILKIIDSNSFLSDKEKSFYSKILRSQLTDFEQLLLYFNSHSLYAGKSNLLVVKYNLFKNIPLFNKPEFLYYYNKSKSSKLIHFTTCLNLFLITHIKKFYDLDFDLPKIEEQFDKLDCIIGICFNDNNLEIKIHCKKNNISNYISLCEEDFHNYLLCVLYDTIVFSTYLDYDKIELEKFITNTQNDKVFGVTIKTEEKINLNEDLF